MKTVRELNKSIYKWYKQCSTHTHTHPDWACTTCSDIDSYFSHCFHKVYLYMPVHTHMTHTYMDTHIHGHTHTHTHTNTHTHTDWACTTCSDISSYFSHCFHKVYLYMPVHTHMTHTYMDTHIHGHTHTHTHTNTHTHTDWACTTCSDIGSYFSHCFHKVYMCMNCTRLCTHT